MSDSFSNTQHINPTLLQTDNLCSPASDLKSVLKLKSFKDKWISSLNRNYDQECLDNQIPVCHFQSERQIQIDSSFVNRVIPYNVGAVICSTNPNFNYSYINLDKEQFFLNSRQVSNLVIKLLALLVGLRMMMSVDQSVHSTN